MSDTMIDLICGDTLQVIPDTLIPKYGTESVHSIITDFPYGLSFVKKEWDTFQSNKAYEEWCREVGEQLFKLLKPGGWILTTSATRTHHRLATGLEDVGFVIYDELDWIYKGGRPKSMGVSLMFDRRAGVRSEIVEEGDTQRKRELNTTNAYECGWKKDFDVLKPTTELGKKWEGWWIGGICPAREPIVVGQKPFNGTCVENLIENGLGAMNIDECRLDSKSTKGTVMAGDKSFPTDRELGRTRLWNYTPHEEGRFPKNVICLDDAMGEVSEHFKIKSYDDDLWKKGDFWYEDKPKKDSFNTHPTVKPVSLMEWMIKLVTPIKQIKDCIVLDPFMGSGSTGVACKNLDVSFIGIDQLQENVDIARKRIEQWKTTAPERRRSRDLLDF